MINVFSAHLKKVKDETESFIAKDAKALPALTVDTESPEQAELKPAHSPLRYAKIGVGKWTPIKTGVASAKAQADTIIASPAKLRR